MPRPGLPPTPASSTEIRGKDQIENIEDFALPPAALHHSDAPPKPSAVSGGIAGGNAATSAESSNNTKRKRRSIAMSATAADQSPLQAASSDTTFTLPPPPSRSRKIIQVQPEDAKGSNSSRPAGQGRRKSETGKGANAGGAPKSTAASRKTARKTAHSIIERRRRSKMNEEFETLKELVPAARGQNMHKLAILQAGIEYVRYLEDCVTGLQDAQSAQSSVKSTPYQAPVDRRPLSNDDLNADDMDEDEDDDMDDDDDEDEERHIATTPRASRPASGYQSQSSVSNTPSPAIAPMHKHAASSSYALSTGSPSPAILPSYHPVFTGTASSSTLPSPALLPKDSRASFSLGSGQTTPITSSAEYHILQAHAKQALASHGEADQEVIATLAMMGTERRRSQEEKDRTDGTRGMSVRDLLSG